MKFLAFLVLIISIATTLTPCCTFDDCRDDRKNASSPQEKKDPCGSCSPFSTCSTCCSAVVVARTIQVSQVLVPKDQYLEFETTTGLPSYISSFWQPPRLS